MRFVDEAKIKVKAGDGGDGMVAWRREKFVPKGGPAGGDGGKGGDVVLIAKEGLSSLLDLKRQTLIYAENGGKGQSKNKTGKNASEKCVYVPLGTQVSFVDSQFIMADMVQEGQRLVICKGGNGGFGNAHFKNPRCHAPDWSTLGKEGEEKEILLTLKLMADAGFLGFPNAGKSTLLSMMSNAKPKVADYPFTTIKPMIGVCEVDIGKNMVLADIPGLIEGASKGIGLGARFLRHLERVRILCHLIDASDENTSFEERFLIINNELKTFGEDLTLAKLPQMVIMTKMDLVSEDKMPTIFSFLKTLKERGIESHMISAHKGYGIEKFKYALFEMISSGLGEKAKKIIKEFNPLKNLY